ncbi:MAG TPA: hypothetical protein VJN42_07290 [Candidatus Acidoferrum sp.]|nr:hypothetical protein [Candidatus Acidoferrum sp.]
MKLRILVSTLFVAALCILYAAPAPIGAQDAPAAPAPPALPAAPTMPAAAIPAPPAVPASFAMPAMPAIPAAPAMPAPFAMPAMPALPAMPAMFPQFEDGWDKHHSMNINSGRHHPLAGCSDLHIEFDDHDAVVKSEERTISKAEAPTLRVRPHRNGGVQVVGWDKDNYSVTACKAASNEDGEAEVILSQIHLIVSNGEVSTDGPSRDDQDWTVYLLIRSPKSAAIDLETSNGPISLYSVDGKLTAHTTNGPISVSDFTGDATIEAVNGPISVSGGSGSLNVHTQNGPISISLKGNSWTGAGISAAAHNGPATLFVPADFQSSFVVETSKYGPISCRAAICDNARKTWDEDNRRIEFGSTPAMIRLSTVNGPVSVQSPRGEM